MHRASLYRAGVGASGEITCGASTRCTAAFAHFGKTRRDSRKPTVGMGATRNKALNAQDFMEKQRRNHGITRSSSERKCRPGSACARGRKKNGEEGARRLTCGPHT